MSYNDGFIGSFYIPTEYEEQESPQRTYWGFEDPNDLMILDPPYFVPMPRPGDLYYQISEYIGGAGEEEVSLFKDMSIGFQLFAEGLEYTVWIFTIDNLWVTKKDDTTPPDFTDIKEIIKVTYND